MTLIEQMAKDSKSPINSDVLQQLSVLCYKQQELEEEVKQQEALLNLKKKELFKVQSQQIPELMESVGMSELKLTDGTKVSIKKEYYASISEDRKEAAFAWLEANGHNIAKKEIIMSYGIMDYDIAAFNNARKLLATEEIDFNVKSSVHASTLKSFVKTQMESAALDEQTQKLLGVYTQYTTKIKGVK